MEPYVDSTYNAVRGYDHTSFAETDVTPDRFEFWLGSNLLGTTYPASSSGTTTTFAYDYDAYGGVNGVARWVRVKAFKGTESDSKGYWLTVWADLEKKQEVSVAAIVPMSIGDGYEYAYSISTPNDNYEILGVIPVVDGVELPWIPNDLSLGSDAMDFTLTDTLVLSPEDLWKAWQFGKKVIRTVKVVWRIAQQIGDLLPNNEHEAEDNKEDQVTGLLTGSIKCVSDAIELGTNTVVKYDGTYFDNACNVTWLALKSGLTNTVNTEANGSFSVHVPTESALRMTYGGGSKYHAHDGAAPNEETVELYNPSIATPDQPQLGTDSGKSGSTTPPARSVGTVLLAALHAG